MEELNDRAVCADSDLKADMERWHKTKKRDFKQVFMAMADRQIRYYERVKHSHSLLLVVVVVVEIS